MLPCPSAWHRGDRLPRPVPWPKAYQSGAVRTISGPQKGREMKQIISRIADRSKEVLGGQRGQGYVEFIISWPLYMFLGLILGIFAWWWWNNLLAATAISDGVRYAAVEGGTIGSGYTEVWEDLAAGLGGFATDYQGKYGIVRMEPLRSVEGQISHSIPFPWPGFSPLRVEASSFQRWERFYPGPPDRWE